MDLMDMHSVARVGFPTSILEVVQEMGRNGRDRNNRLSEVTDSLYSVLPCNDFVYLNQHLYIPPENEISYIDPTIDREANILMQRDHLLRLLKIIVLEGKFWYIQLEDFLANPCKPLLNRQPCVSLLYLLRQVVCPRF